MKNIDISIKPQKGFQDEILRLIVPIYLVTLPVALVVLLAHTPGLAEMQILKIFHFKLDTRHTCVSDVANVDELARVMAPTSR